MSSVLVFGNEVTEHCGADVRTCFFMQTTEQVAMPLKYILRRKQICKTYVYVFNICLIYCGGVTYKINKENCIVLGYYAASSVNSLAMFPDNLSSLSSGDP
jgi:hypothetical protein